MEKKFKIYLDTSVPNFIFADDAPEKKEITIEFFENFINHEVYRTYISEVVIAEIENASNIKKKNELLEIIENNPINLLESNEEEDIEIQELAEKYIEKK